MTTHEQAQRRRGRPSARPGAYLARRIADQMRRRGITQQMLAARLGISHSTVSRFLAGRIQRTHLSPQRLADALEFRGQERARFLRDCRHQRLSSDGAAPQPAAKRAYPQPRRARVRRISSVAVGGAGQLVQPLIETRGMSRRELAAALGVEESTVSRIMSGKHATSYAVSAEGVSAALGLRGIDRREFLKRAAELGAFALVSGAGGPLSLRYRGFDFAQFDAKLRDAEQLLLDGHARQAFDRARELESTIRKAPFLPTHKEAATRRVETALLVGRTQEAVYPWGERTVHALRTYERIDGAILSYFAPSEMPERYAMLYERRAPLYRELAAYDDSIREFTLAIELFMRNIDDVGFLVTLYRNRAHVWAVQGDERRWLRDIREAEQAAGRAPAAMRRRLEGLVLYSTAEGYKRLAGTVPPEDVTRRTHYARLALDHFDKARFVGESEWAPHRLIAGVSETQCLVWLDADEAIRRAESWRADASEIYPSLLKKIDATVAAANRQQKRRGATRSG
jgi:transcriptional regulator with XRE-family HTH domain